MTPIEKTDAAYRLHCEAFDLARAGDQDGAADKWTACVNLADEPLYLCALAECMARLRRWEEELHWASLAAAHDPTNPEAWALMGAACGYLGRQADAKMYYDRAEAIAPNSHGTLLNLGLWHLLHGDYTRGWPLYNWRKLQPGHARTLKPEWDGSPIPGRTLFVWTEQGFGDTFHFSRVLKAAKERSQARVVFEVQRELVGFFHRRPGFADEVMDRTVGGSIPFGDFEHCSLIDLPRILGITDEASFWDSPYIEAAERQPHAPAGSSAPNRSVPSEGDPFGALRVGICTAGSAVNANDKSRSLTAEHADALRALADVDGIETVLLTPTEDYLTTFDETASVIAGLDLVVTVDTAVAHLAGAMGKPVFILLPFAPDWRWNIKHAGTTPWYPSATLFRQPAYGDWASVIEVVTTAVKWLSRRATQKAKAERVPELDPTLPPDPPAITRRRSTVTVRPTFRVVDIAPSTLPPVFAPMRLHE